MNENLSSSWIWRLVARIVSHALLGGLVCALCGAILIGVSGALTGWILDIRSTPPGYLNGFLVPGAFAGVYFGTIGGSVAGSLMFGISGFLLPPHFRALPPRFLLQTVVLWMLAATVGVMSSFFCLAASFAIYSDSSFAKTVEDWVLIILFLAPAVMVAGQIIGMMQGFRRLRAEKSDPTLSVLPLRSVGA